MSCRSIYIILVLGWFFQTSCNSSNDRLSTAPAPKEIIDLGELLSPDTTAILPWAIERWGGIVNGRNSYFGFSNHSGAHIDAPNHVGLKGGLDSYSIEADTGKVKIFDVSDYPTGRSIPIDVFNGLVDSSNVVLIYTGYKPQDVDDQSPEGITLSYEAAQYLADIPVKAFGTDSWSVGNSQHPGEIPTQNPGMKAMPVHYSFLSKGIPVYEKLTNLNKLLYFELMYFVGVPLNIQEADGMLVRPVVLVY